MLTTVNQSVTTATMSKQNGLIRQIETWDFHLSRITSRRGMLFAPNKASDNALGIAALIDDPTVISRDAGIDVYRNSK